jgi:hypothetical protein
MRKNIYKNPVEAACCITLSPHVEQRGLFHRKTKMEEVLNNEKSAISESYLTSVRHRKTTKKQFLGETNLWS